MFEHVEHLILDLDGAVYRGNKVIPGVAAALERARRAGIGLTFCSNNSTGTREQFAAKLTGMGIRASAAEVVHSSWAAGRYLAHRHLHTALVVGESGLCDELTRAGVHVFPAPADDPVECVVVGLDREFTYAKLAAAQRALAAGALFIATNRDTVLPTEHGLLPGSGSIVSAVETAAGQAPLVIGKPEPLMIDLIVGAAGLPRGCFLLAGDRLDTDVECGNRAGIPTALVLTGVSTKADAKAAPPPRRPTAVFRDLSELIESLLVG